MMSIRPVIIGLSTVIAAVALPLTVAGSLAVLSTAAEATLLQVNPTDDNSAAQSAGFGSVLLTGELHVELLPGPGFPVGHVLSRSALEFDISSIPTGSTINSAALTLSATTPVFSATDAGA